MRKLGLRFAVVATFALLVSDSRALAQAPPIVDLSGEWSDKRGDVVRFEQKGTKVTLTAPSGRVLKGDLKGSSLRLTGKFRGAEVATAPPDVQSELERADLSATLQLVLTPDGDELDGHENKPIEVTWEGTPPKLTHVGSGNSVVSLTRVLPCKERTRPVPPDFANGKTLLAHDWTGRAEITPDQGLKLGSVELAKRHLADSMALTRLELPTLAPGRACALRQKGMEDTCRTRLVAVGTKERDGSTVVFASYAVERIPKDSKNCVILTQSYELGPSLNVARESPDDRCEPFGILSCARLRPLIDYEFRPEKQSDGSSLRLLTEQEFHFKVDGKAVNAGLFTRDVDGTGAVILNLLSPIEVLGGNPVSAPDRYKVIESGNAIANAADNYHQAGEDAVELPTVLSPGCPRCVHIHWRWSSNVSNLTTAPQFGGGKAILPSGSTQSVAVYASGGPSSPVFHYIAEGRQLSDTFFWHGMWFSPHPSGNLFVPANGGRLTRELLQHWTRYSGGSPAKNYFKVGSDLVWDFHNSGSASFDYLVVDTHSDERNYDSVKEFEVSVADAADGPFTPIGRYALKSAEQSVYRVGFSRTKARYVKIHLVSSWRGETIDLESPPRLFGILEK